jgi:hypothetical protein
MSHSARLLQILKARGDNNASQSMAFDNYLNDNPEWAFRADVEFAQCFNLNSNTSCKSSYVDKLAESCGAADQKALVLFLQSVNNVSTQSGMCDKIFPFMDKAGGAEDALGILKDANSATASSARSTWEEEGGSKLGKTASAEVYLGGYHIVSKKLAQIHAALKAVGNCDQGYEWKKGNFDHPCDKCAKSTGKNGYNCAGGSHYVCLRCVKASMGGTSGMADGDDDEGIIVPRHDCYNALLECNNGAAEVKGDMNSMMMLQATVMRKHNIPNPESLSKSCELYSQQGDKEIAAEYEKFGNIGAQMMMGAMGGGSSANPMAAMMGGMAGGFGNMPGGPPPAGGGANPMAAMMGGMAGAFGNMPGGPPPAGGGANPMGMMGNMMGGFGMNMGSENDDDEDDGFGF